MSAPEEQGLPPAYAEVRERYGALVFDLAMSRGLAGQAAEVLAALVRKHASRGGQAALGSLVAGYNHAYATLVREAKIDEAMLVACDNAIQRAYAESLVVAESPLILPGRLH